MQATKYENIMLDLETLGTSADAVVLSIGAVAFDPRTGEFSNHTFHRFLDIDEQLIAGRKISGDTVVWWLSQADDARNKLIDGYDERESLQEVLQAFTEWLKRVADPKTVCMWGNGAAFDNAILADLHRTAGLPQPWMFWNDRCFRTLKSLNKHVPAPAHEGVAHDALDDAIKQAKHLQAIFNATWKKVASVEQ